MPVITVRQGAIDARAEAQPAQVATLQYEASDSPSASIRNFEERAVAAGRPELRGAAKVVSGGRGLQSGEQFALVDQLADVLGAAVGASRAAVDAGYVPQGSRLVRPVSRSPLRCTSRWVSRCDPAPGRDADGEDHRGREQGPDAPIFDIADFGVVGDVFR